MDHHHEHLPLADDDGVDRRGFLKCMAWAGTGLLYTLHGGVLKSFNLSSLASGALSSHDLDNALRAATFSFVQISDSHIGFSKDANKNVIETLQVAIDRINSASVTPDLLIHTGDLSHLSKGDEFDALDQVLKGLKTKDHFFVPGEHDVLEDAGALYKQRYGKQGKGDGWYSFDHKGVHFIGLVNVMNLKPGGLGALGNEQLEWLEADVKGLHSSTPIVVFAHVPLWTVYPDWGWGTDDGAQALSYLKRFGSVTVLNGHIHQTMQKVEGNMFFHTACSTAFPQPKPGQAKGPGPMVVPADQLRGLLGLTSVQYLEHQSHLAVVDSTLADKAMTSDAKELTVKIDNFSFSPSPLSIALGTRVTWVNHDDIPHNVVETHGAFKSKTLDTDDHYEHVFNDKGTFEYYCSIHPHMTGKIIVQ